jgi:DNA-binding GntR family transcriptional regulator
MHNRAQERTHQMLAPQITADLIATDLRRNIQSGEVPPGSVLRQEEIARRFAVSRIPVREALRSLERDGLVRVVPNRGAYVIELTSAQIAEIIHLRVLLESDLVALAVPGLSDDSMQRIKTAANAAQAAAATPEWSIADDAFHRALYLPAARPQQLELAMSLRSSLQRYWSIYRQLPAKRGEWLRDHAQLARAYAKRDPDLARRHVVKHIEQAGTFLLSMHERALGTNAARLRS